ncbi:MAG: biotin synthase BioB [Planctomyces sp.]|nr:biotin synthase BioB [Planctomyces sp.]
MSVGVSLPASSVDRKAEDSLGEFCWSELADRVIAGHQLTREEGLAILASKDEELLDVLGAAYKVRRKHFGRKVHLYFLKNAKSGLCPEDCGYCSQSKVAESEIPKYAMLNEAKLMEGAARAVEASARTYCIVASGRGPSNREVNHVASVAKKIKETYGLHICCCLGLLSPDQAKTLAEAGVDRINHNLNTGRNFYDKICTTHTYDDRLETLRVVREAGMELCSGLIVGMGETQNDLVDVAFELRDLGVESIPVNFLHAIDGTPLERKADLDPRQCLRALCLFRLANPTVEIRVSGGREVNLRSMQAMSLYAANSMFVSDYLTTKGQPAEDDFKMVQDLGMEVVIGDHEAYLAWKAAQSGEPSQGCGTNSVCGSGSHAATTCHG